MNSMKLAFHFVIFCFRSQTIVISNYTIWLRCRRKPIMALNGAVKRFVSFLRNCIGLIKLSKFRLRWSAWVHTWPEVNFQELSPFWNVQVASFKQLYVTLQKSVQNSGFKSRVATRLSINAKSSQWLQAESHLLYCKPFGDWVFDKRSYHYCRQLCFDTSLKQLLLARLVTIESEKSTSAS